MSVLGYAVARAKAHSFTWWGQKMTVDEDVEPPLILTLEEATAGLAKARSGFKHTGYKLVEIREVEA